MKATYTTNDGRLRIEFEASTQKELFRELHRFQEVFEDTAEAMIDGKLYSSNDIKYVVRKAEYVDEKGKTKQAEYFEKQIRNGPLMWYKKSYGVLDDGTDGLFPKKAPDDPKFQIGRNGWHKYVVGND